MVESIERRIAAISALYIHAFGRIVDIDGLNNYVSSSEDIQLVAKKIFSSPECMAVDSAAASVLRKLSKFSAKRKVLLFGAYGNGNLGDREMAAAIAHRLERDGEIVCFSYSDLASADYPFPAGRILDRAEMPMNMRIMALFDALIIGGGGLLSYHHDPLWDPGWARGVPVPLGVLACGVGAPLDDRLINLVRAATVVSSRDEPGLSELRRHASNAMLCNDPILSFFPTAGSGAPNPGRGVGRRLYVLRAPLHPWHLKIRDALRDGDAVCVFEVHMDFPIVYEFDDVIPIGSATQFSELVRNFDVVITERYHGAIIALLNHCPVIGVCRGSHTSKISELFRQFGLGAHIRMIDDMPTDFSPYDPAGALEAIEVVRGMADAEYDRFIRDLFVDRGADDVRGGEGSAEGVSSGAPELFARRGSNNDNGIDRSSACQDMAARRTEKEIFQIVELGRRREVEIGRELAVAHERELSLKGRFDELHQLAAERGRLLDEASATLRALQHELSLARGWEAEVRVRLEDSVELEASLSRLLDQAMGRINDQERELNSARLSEGKKQACLDELRAANEQYARLLDEAREQIEMQGRMLKSIQENENVLSKKLGEERTVSSETQWALQQATASLNEERSRAVMRIDYGAEPPL